MDLSQFYQVFFEESFELIDNIEQVLLKLDVKAVELETINSIFRCAHSIKGSSATFGFNHIASFTHAMENYLDLIRKGEKKFNQDLLELLLKSLDCLRSMIFSLQNNQEHNSALAKSLIDQFAYLSAEVCSSDASLISSSQEDLANRSIISANENKIFHWEIEFKPNLKIFQTGNDPITIFNELSKLGQCDVKVELDNLPSLENFQVDECYFSWRCYIKTICNKEKILQEVFDWVACDSEIIFFDHSQKNFSHDDLLSNSDSISSANSMFAQITKDKKTHIHKETQNNFSLTESTSIRVPIDKLDSLINLVGELVITQAMLVEIGNNFSLDRLSMLKSGFSKLEQDCRGIQEQVMRIRMLPISYTFNRFKRIVHDISKPIGKEIELKISGENTELDKTVLEKINDPLVHLIRNAIDHGIESKQDRIKAGKSATGILSLNAFHQGGNIIIQVSDDGKGLNRDKILAKAKQNKLISQNEVLTNAQIDELIFKAGFSTADKVTDISGRGVGMDVVKKNIESLGGRVKVSSIDNQGSVFTITLPLTLAILDGQLVNIGGQIYIIPLIAIKETLNIKKQYIKRLTNQLSVYQFRSNYIPIISLYNIFDICVESKSINARFLLIVEVEHRDYGIIIDGLLQQQQVVIKSLENNYKKIEGISGATILGSGEVAFILDISGIVKIQSQYYKNVIEEQAI